MSIAVATLRIAALVLALLLPAGLAGAQTGNDWFKDPTTGCRLYYPGADASLVVRWSGGCAGGLANGTGAFEFLSKGQSVAKGEATFVAGKREGRAFVVKKDGMRLEAEYRGGDAVGKAVEIWPGGDRYIGEYANGEKNGYGVYTWADGKRYEGQWANDNRNGKGIFTSPNGDRYEGEWKNSKRDGRGTYIWGDGDRYDGDYKEGRPHGQGVFRGHRDGDGKPFVWAGEWRNGCFNNGRDKVNINATKQECGF
jgi:hypothetical protein